MVKNYSKIEFIPGDTLESAVNQLLKFKEQGNLVYGKFNGVTLFSDIVTMDSAYKDVTGMTKAEFDECIK